MDRRKLVAGAATVVAMVLLVLASSSGPLRIWITPSPDGGQSSVDGAGPLDTVSPQDSVSTDRSDGAHWGSFFAQLVGVLLIVVVVAVVVAVGRAGRWPRLRRRGLHERRDRHVTPLPEVLEHEVKVDVDAARAALASGAPRNAIVACWMQLERDAAAAGLAREAAETSAEYVERVVAQSSVDPAPIGELAVLYREARFSRHELRDDHRVRALAALNRVEAALMSNVEVPA